MDMRYYIFILMCSFLVTSEFGFLSSVCWLFMYPLHPHHIAFFTCFIFVIIWYTKPFFIYRGHNNLMVYFNLMVYLCWDIVCLFYNLPTYIHKVMWPLLCLMLGTFILPKIIYFIFPSYSHFTSLWQPVDNFLFLCLSILDIEHKYSCTINVKAGGCFLLLSTVFSELIQIVAFASI